MSYSLEVGGDIDASEVREAVEAILRDNSLCSLATVGGTAPHINTAYFAVMSGLRLAILTPPNTQHAANVHATPDVAMAIFDSHQPWGSDLRGLQLKGSMELLSDSGAADAFEAYSTRNPGLVEWAANYGQLEENMESRFYALTVDWVKVFDEPRFGKENYIVATVSR